MSWNPRDEPNQPKKKGRYIKGIVYVFTQPNSIIGGEEYQEYKGKQRV